MITWIGKYGSRAFKCRVERISTTPRSYSMPKCNFLNLTKNQGGGHPKKKRHICCFWLPFWTSSCPRKCSKRHKTIMWVCKIIYRCRATRRTKNHVHTTSQSKVMKQNKILRLKKKGSWGGTVSTLRYQKNSVERQPCFWWYSFLDTGKSMATTPFESRNIASRKVYLIDYTGVIEYLQNWFSICINNFFAIIKFSILSCFEVMMSSAYVESCLHSFTDAVVSVYDLGSKHLHVTLQSQPLTGQ